MKIQSILNIAMSAKTASQIQSVYGQVRAELDSHNKYKYLQGSAQNDETTIEDGYGPYMTFNYVNYLHRAFGTYHAIEIIFALKEGGFTAHIALIHFKDGLGESSRDYERVREENIDFTTDENATAKSAFESIAAVANSWNISIYFRPENKVENEVTA